MIQEPLPFSTLEFPMPRLLTPAESRFLKNALEGDESAVIASANNLEITRSDLCLLAAKRKLNDQCMNFYLALAVSRLQELGRNVQCASSLITVLFRNSEDNPSSVRSFRSDVNPFDYDMISIPLHLPNHWIGIGMDIDLHQIHVGDSLNLRCDEEIKHLITWLKDMYLRKYNIEDDLPWTVVYVPSPPQNNDIDCGVFALLFCICFMMGKQCRNLYSQSNIVHFRRLFALHILSTSIEQNQAELPPASNILVAIRLTLQAIPNSTCREITNYIDHHKLYVFTGDATRALNSVFTALRRNVKRGILIKRGSQRSSTYSLNTYSAVMAGSINAKKPVYMRCEAPTDASDLSLGDSIVSLLYRYDRLNFVDLRRRLVDDNYREDPGLIRQSVNYWLSSLCKAGDIRRYKGPDGVYIYRLANETLPPIGITQTQLNSGAELHEIDGETCLVVSSEAQGNFLRTAQSSLGGTGIFLTQYVGAKTLFELVFKVKKLSSKRGKFDFRIATPFDKQWCVTARIGGEVESLVAYANDAGPRCSQLVPMMTEVDKTEKTLKLYWACTQPLDAGTELFCAYNTGEAFNRSHWNFDYPENWVTADAVNPADLHVDFESIRKQRYQVRRKHVLREGIGGPPNKAKLSKRDSSPKRDSSSKPEKKKPVAQRQRILW